MEKINLRILFFLSLLASLFKSDDYNYDDYDEYNYDRNYDYHNPKSEDYTDDYSQQLNDYYGNQNLLAPAPPPFIPPSPPPPMDYNHRGHPRPMDFGFCVNNWCHQKGTMGQYTRCKSVSNNGRTCHHPEIKYGSTIGGKPGGVWIHQGTNYLTEWCIQLFPRFGNGFFSPGSPAGDKIYGTALYKVIYLDIFILKVS